MSKMSLFRLFRDPRSPGRLRALGANLCWLILIVSPLSKRLYSQSPTVRPSGPAPFVNCRVCDSGPLRHDSRVPTFNNQTWATSFSLSRSYFSLLPNDSSTGWRLHPGGGLSGTATIENHPWSQGPPSNGFGISLWAQNKQNPAQDQQKPAVPSAANSSPGHIFWVVPAYKVEYGKDFKPLTSKEKFLEWARGAYDPLGLAVDGVEAATLEHSSTDGFCGYGGGWVGYGKCYGSLELDADVSSFIGDYALTTLLHQDPRYFRLGRGSFGKRLWYAVSRVFVTYNDSGRTVFYTSALSGTAIAAGLSNLYAPQQDRGFGHSMSRIALDLGNTALYNASAEFWADIDRKLHDIF